MASRSIHVGGALIGITLLLNGCGGGGGAGGGGGGGGGGTPAPPPSKPMVPTECPANFKRGHCTKCIGNGQQFECQTCADPYALNSDKKQTPNACAIDCKNFKPSGTKPSMPANALSHNGIEWPSICFDGGDDS